jgi:hypothetical protein
MARKKLTTLQVFLETKRIEAAEAQTIDDRMALRKIIGFPYNTSLVIDDVVYTIKTSEYGDTYITSSIR